MLGILISVAMGGLMVFVALRGLRQGSLPVGERGLRRGDRGFLPAVAGFAAIGVGLWAFTGWVIVDDAAEGQRPPRTIEGEGWQGSIPPSWEALPRDGMPPDAALWGDGESELMVTQSQRPLAVDEPTAVRDALRRALTDVSVTERPPRWREGETSLAATWDYPSPRGPVKTTALGWITEGPTMHVVVAVCTDGAERGSCEPTASSLHATGGLALSAPLEIEAASESAPKAD